MKSRNSFSALILAGSFTLFVGGQAHAQMPAAWNTAAVTSGVDYLATGSATTMTWSDTTAWSGGVAANTAGKTVSLEPRQTGAMTVTVDGTYTIGSLTSRNPNNNLAFTGSGKLIFDNGSNPSIWNLNSRTTRFTNLRPDINIDLQLNSNLEIRMGSARSDEAAVGRIGKIISGDGKLTLTLGQNDGATNRLFKLGNGASANTYTGGTEIRHIVAISGTGQYGAGFNSQSGTLLVNALSTGTFGTGDVLLNSQGLNTTAVTALTAATGGLQVQFSANNVMASTAKLTQSGNGAGLILMGATLQTIAGLETTGTATESGRKRISSTSATLTMDTISGQTYSYNGIITGGTAIQVKGSGTQIFTNANSYTAGTTVTGGTLLGTNSSAFGTNSGLNIGNAATAAYIPSVAGALNLGTGVLTLNAGSTIGTALAGATLGQSAITSSVAAVVPATGTVTVDIMGIPGVAPALGVNNLITAGSGLDAGATFALGKVNIYNNTDYTVSGISTGATAISTTVASATPIGAAYWKGGFTGSANMWAISDGSANSNWVTTAGGGATGLVPGAGADVFISAGTVTTAPTATVLGASMTINSLTLSDTTYGMVLNSDGNTLTVNSAAGITMNASVPASSIAANVALGAGQTWTIGSASSLTVSGVVSGGTNTLTKDGAGVLTLSGANTYTGLTTVNSGELDLNKTGGQAIAGNLTVSGGTAKLLQASQIAVAGSLVVSSGTFDIQGFNQTLAGVQMTGGNLNGSGGVLTSTTAFDMQAGSVSAKLGGSVGLNKSTGGTVTLSGVNTYSGATLISGGTLALAVGGSIDFTTGVALGTSGTFDVSAKSGYTVTALSGSGSVTGALTVSTTLAIGNSTGKVDFSSDLTLGSGTSYNFELVGGTTGAGSADLGNVAGTLYLAGATLNLTQLGTYTPNEKFTLFSYQTGVSGTFAGLADGGVFNDLGSNPWQINYSDTAGTNGGTYLTNVTITAIPETSAAVLGALGMLALLRRRRA